VSEIDIRELNDGENKKKNEQLKKTDKTSFEYIN
jgi:hypothetical protein